MKVRKPASRDRAHIGKLGRQILRLDRRSIGDEDAAQLPLHQGAEHPPHRAACPQNEHSFVGQRQFHVQLEIAGQPQAVRVVAQQSGVFEIRDGVHRLRPRRPRREFVHQFGRRLLVGHRDVDAADTAGEKRQDIAAKGIGGDVEQPVSKVLSSRFREHAVDERRPTMRNRMSNDTILIARTGLMGQIHRRSHSAARFAK